MLQPEPFHSEPVSWTSRYTSSALTRQGSSKRAVVQSSEIDDLVAQLVPEGVSANKRAVIETLVARWLENSRAAS